MIHIPGRRLVYRTVQIRVVEPEDTSLLQVEDGRDYCTLLTCTPYGVNSHRLLVRGERVSSEDTSQIRLQEERGEDLTRSEWVRRYLRSLLISAVCMAVVSFTILTIRRIRT